MLELVEARVGVFAGIEVEVLLAILEHRDARFAPVQFAQNIAEKGHDDLAGALVTLITVVELTDLDERGHDVILEVAFAGAYTTDDVIEGRARDPALERRLRLHVRELLGGSVDRSTHDIGVLGEQRAHAPAHYSTHGYPNEDLFEHHQV